MTRILPRFTFPATLIFIVTGTQLAISGLYIGLGLEVPESFSLLARVNSFWAAGWWLRDDLRKRGEDWIYCPGLFLWIAWPIVLPYYLLKTRGLKALIVIAIFLGICLAASFVGGALGVLLAESFNTSTTRTTPARPAISRTLSRQAVRYGGQDSKPFGVYCQWPIDPHRH